ncbi:cell wall-associated NlpC family hydrolase [Nonomuraea jabiensis]|uniref:Cell wall-associated NlpC family hydrolase n=1 Tax=Nonomuraea jabiensis TaxID=882448 RepID=A0A7W9G0G3_9ACTN|nr:cell wall-associated NlpC family hydrolase [Nonomuraea jabiensis]
MITLPTFLRLTLGGILFGGLITVLTPLPTSAQAAATRPQRRALATLPTFTQTTATRPQPKTLTTLPTSAHAMATPPQPRTLTINPEAEPLQRTSAASTTNPTTRLDRFDSLLHTPGRRITTLTRGQIAASAALDQLGVSFSWGGGSAKGPTIGIGRGAGTRGFDCSGLTLYAWSKAGITLAHYTGAQFRQGRRIPFRARRTGDLLFFGGGTGDPTHVALFLRDGLMIHAPRTGDVVRKTNFLASPYFRSVYRGVVRPG